MNHKLWAMKGLSEIILYYDRQSSGDSPAQVPGKVKLSLAKHKLGNSFFRNTRPRAWFSCLHASRSSPKRRSLSNLIGKGGSC